MPGISSNVSRTGATTGQSFQGALQRGVGNLESQSAQAPGNGCINTECPRETAGRSAVHAGPLGGRPYPHRVQAIVQSDAGHMPDDARQQEPESQGPGGRICGKQQRVMFGPGDGSAMRHQGCGQEPLQVRLYGPRAFQTLACLPDLRGRGRAQEMRERLGNVIHASIVV